MPALCCFARESRPELQRTALSDGAAKGAGAPEHDGHLFVQAEKILHVLPPRHAVRQLMEIPGMHFKLLGTSLRKNRPPQAYPPARRCVPRNNRMGLEKSLSWSCYSDTRPHPSKVAGGNQSFVSKALALASPRLM